jgi:hypothetical protein
MAPNAASTIPPGLRSMPGSTDAPAAASATPITVNESASPRPSAKGPRRCAFIAAAMSTGTSGSTQGDRIDSAPAASPSP